ncbi:MAG: hypothetical protein QXQ48_09450 [Nitrososphaerota archaeon]
MGLDIAVVRETILPRPNGVVYRFAWHLAEQAGQCYGGEGNSFYWYFRDYMEKQAKDFAERKQLSSVQLDQIIAWIRSLPWDGDYIILHFNW